MKRKLLALLLATALLASLLAGCSGGETTPAATEAPASEAPAPAPASEAPAAPASEAPAPAAEGPASGDALVASEAMGELVAQAGTDIVYPLADPSAPIVFTQFNPWVSVFEPLGFSSWNDMPCNEAALQATGIDYEFMDVSMTAASEQFNLMVASGEMTDAMRCADYYTNGVTAAYADEVIIDLTDLIPTYAPEYFTLLMNTNEATIDQVTNDGMYLQVAVIKTDPYSDQGVVARGDWLEELGLDVPDSFEEFDAALHAFAETYGTKSAFYVDATGKIDLLGNIFDCGIFDVSGNATGIAPTLTDGVYHSDLVSDNYRAYLEYFIKLIADGVIDKDFFTTDLTDVEMRAAAGNGEYGFWFETADSLDTAAQLSDDADFYAAPLTYLYNDDGEYTYGATITLADNKGYSISASCADPETLLSYWNYFYTEEGGLLANFGIEGEAHYIDENGNPRFTDLILNNPNAVPLMATVVYTYAQIPMLNDTTKMLADTYSEAALEAIDVWSDRTGVVALHEVPSNAALNSEETNQISTIVTDIMGYASEQVLKFMTGVEPLNDETWAAYCAQCETLGLSEVVAVYQNAYDEYLTGNRVVVSTSTAGGPPEGGGAPPDGGPPPGDMDPNMGPPPA